MQPTPQGTDSSVSKIPLALHLTATRLGRNSQEGYADIGVNVLSPQTYGAGAVLANGARLTEIYTDSVVLERNGERLRLYVDGIAPAVGDASLLSPLTSVGGPSLVLPASANSRDPLTEVVRIAPVFSGNQVRALELYPNAQSAKVFQRLGLEPGDRIIAIDGAAVKDAGEAIAEFRSVTTGAALNVTIERGGARQNLSIDGSIFQTSARN